MPDNPRCEWPMTSYESVWKCFRRLSDENVATALHLIARPHWPRTSGLTIADVGCGDGLLTQQIVLHSPGTVSEVRLIDPDAGFLEEATRQLTDTPDSIKVIARQHGVESLEDEDFLDVSVVLAVHVVYLMRDGAFDIAVRQLPVGVPLYVVLDEPNSVFSRLWGMFSTKYLQRSKTTHERIARLPEDGFTVDRTTITSHIDNPLAQRQDIKDAILSILCYADARDFSAEEYEAAEAEIRKSLVGQQLHCESVCYEIVRSQ
ncbi:hypothetical protein LCGC14_2288120 [marine sediment metagenome]|uniref:Methyltransferase domain-containing protein n=1 Tax=marine sediment metagenome TaxID=412755 RepID=A0A0F9DEL6_9ZZZZ